MNNMTEPLKALVERISDCMDNVDDMKADLREIYADAKGNGYNVAALRVIVREHRQNLEQQRKREQIESDADLYRAALGMLDGTPLGDAAITRAIPEPQPVAQKRRGRPLGSKNRPKAHPQTDIVDNITGHFFSRPPAIPVTPPEGADVTVSFAPPPIPDDEVF